MRSLFLITNEGRTFNQDWKRLKISEHKKELSLRKNRGDFPANLYLIRRVNSKNIYATYLLNEEDDPRVRKGEKKRIEIESSTGVDDSIIAARIAIAWVKTKQNELQKNIITKLDHQKNYILLGVAIIQITLNSEIGKEFNDRELLNSNE